VPGRKRRLALSVLSFPLVLFVLVCVLFVAGGYLGIVSVACSAPRGVWFPVWFFGGLVVSIAAAAFVAVRIHRWLSARAAAREDPAS
jgi:hypothetical protein